MISKKLLSEFRALSEKEKQAFLFEKVLDGSLSKEHFDHLIVEYALNHPKYPETTGDCW